MLRTALGPAIALWLEDVSVVEVMLNPDGRLWIDRLAGGLVDTGERLSPGDGEAHLAACRAHVSAPKFIPIHHGFRRSCPRPASALRGLLPPVVYATVLCDPQTRGCRVYPRRLCRRRHRCRQAGPKYCARRSPIGRSSRRSAGPRTGRHHAGRRRCWLAEVAKHRSPASFLIEDTGRAAMPVARRISSHCAPKTASPRSPVRFAPRCACGRIASHHRRGPGC